MLNKSDGQVGNFFIKGFFHEMITGTPRICNNRVIRDMYGNFFRKKITKFCEPLHPVIFVATFDTMKWDDCESQMTQQIL